MLALEFSISFAIPKVAVRIPLQQRPPAVQVLSSTVSFHLLKSLVLILGLALHLQPPAPSQLLRE